METLDVARMVVDFGLVVLIWLVQLIIYPSFARVAPDTFGAWHARYQRLISLFVVPLMVAQVALVGLQLARGIDGWTLTAAGLVAAMWLVTFLVSVPAHRVLAREGNGIRHVDRLTGTNWWRTAGWTAVFLTGLA